MTEQQKEDASTLLRRQAVPGLVKFAFLSVMLLSLVFPAFASPNLEQQLSDLFVGHSFTIRDFYRGKTLRYGSNGLLLEKAEPGYWSRDGMVEFTSVKISKDNKLIFQGKRTCVLFDPAQAEFSNVWTGDRVQIEVQLTQDQLSLGAVAVVLQKVLLSSRDHLADLIPPYWTNCLRRRVDRPDKHSSWECEAQDKQKVPDFTGKKISWDIPPPDNSLRNGMQLYTLQHRVGYLTEAGATAPRLLVGPDPIFQWEQRRTHLDAMTLVLALTVGEDGRPRDISIVSPVGMGMDDDAAVALGKWQFRPGTCHNQPCPVPARVVFDINAPNARPSLVR